MNGHALLALQQLDSELDHLAALERRLAERAAFDVTQATHRAWKSERDQRSAEVQACLAKITEAEAEGAAIAKKRARLEAQLKTVIAPREAEALMHEIQRLQSDSETIDDAELEAMQQQADAEAAIQVLDDREPTLLESINQARGLLDSALGQLLDDRTDLHRRRTMADAAITADERDLYAAMRARHDGMGVVHLEGRRCTGCHLDLSAMEADQVKNAPSDELPECPHCARLIVR